MFRNSRQFLLILLLCGLLAGCGGGSDEDTGNTGSRGNGNEDNGSGKACFAGGESADPDGEYSLPDMPEGSMPGHGPDKMAEHMAAMALVDYDQATHAAVNDGAWCNPDTWHNRTVPGDGARVVIPEGHTVRYDVIDDARLHTVRVDGRLEFSSTQPSQMVLDTMVVDPRGTLVIGTAENPVLPDVDVNIIIADNGDIDTGWDPMLLSRGIVAHGRTMIHGARKTTHLKVAIDPLQGDDTLTLAEAPENWRDGDTLVIAGTKFSGWKWDNDVRAVTYHGTQDEVRTITAVNGNIITLDEPLEYDHVTPRADLKASVANYTRNVSIETENAESVATHQRGHVMFMHNNDVDVRYAEFRELGRTDKSVASFDAGDVADVQPDSNVRGRYSFHFHRTGVKDFRNPGVGVGNAVFGSPGWGFVHHDSHALLYDNASFDTFGAGFVAETGNETGTWARNIAIKAEGNSAFNPKNGNDPGAFDMGRTGDGFWFQGRMVRSADNVAASVNHGFVYLHRGTGMLNFAPEKFMLPEALGLGDDATPDDAPIRGFDGNEAFASTVGLYVVKANPMQEHDVYTTLTDFVAWEVTAGAAIEYTSHYLLKDFDIIANTPERFRSPQFGIGFGTNTTDMVVNNARIEGFPEGIRLQKNHTFPAAVGKDQFVIIDAEYVGVTTPLVDYDPSLDVVLDGDALVPGRFSIDLDGGPFEYLDPATTWGTGAIYTGEKTDSIGVIPLPAGADELATYNQDMIAIVEKEGYFRTASGDAYAIVEQYFSDRATGEIHKYGLKTYLGPQVDAAMQNTFTAWGDAVYLGEIDLTSQPPVGNDDTATTAFETDIVIDVIANDTDAEGDTLAVDGIVPPRNGHVFDNGDGTVTYRPGIGFHGRDSFYYWVTDSQGNFSRADVTVNVSSP